MLVHFETQSDLEDAIHVLVKQDPRLKPVLAATGMPMVLEATGNDRLRAERKRIIGWARCTDPGRTLDVVQ